MTRSMLASLLAALHLVVPPPAAAASAPRIVGAVEQVWLVPWGLAVRARIDTGAERSSIDARDVSVSGARGRRIVRFTLGVDGGRRRTVEAPLAGFRTIVTPGGLAQRRPSIEIELCLAGVRTRVEVTLNDRHRMDFRMIVGRDLLKGRFLVDVAREATAPPGCPGAR